MAAPTHEGQRLAAEEPAPHLAWRAASANNQHCTQLEDAAHQTPEPGRDIATLLDAGADCMPAFRTRNRGMTTHALLSTDKRAEP